MLWAGEAGQFSFEAFTKIEDTPADYKVVLRPEPENRIGSEQLLINEMRIISSQDGEGVVCDEDGKNETTFKSEKLALKSAGEYGNKPVTRALTEYIGKWEFYDFQPRRIRSPLTRLERVLFDESRELNETPQLDDEGSILSELLSFWHENERERFESVSDSLADSTNIRIGHEWINGKNQLCLWEGYENPIPLEGASDGTLRLAAYYTLLNEPVARPLIAIEEPERNLHPRALKDIAFALELIAEKTQVIITTHSSQLLDAFSIESQSDALGVLLLRNPPGRGTAVHSLDDIRQDRAALDGWVTDFGLGSGIFHSNLLQDLMES